MKIRAIRVEPGRPAVEAWIDPKHLERLVGGRLFVRNPQDNGIAVISRKLEWYESLPADRMEIDDYGLEICSICGTAYIAGRDKGAKQFRSLEDSEFSRAMEDYGKPRLKTVHRYGIRKGEELSITSGLKPYFEERMPDRIEALEEYPAFILCMAHYEDRSFRFCINKASIICGDTKVRRKKTGKMLG